MNDNVTSGQADYWVITGGELQKGDEEGGRKNLYTRKRKESIRRKKGREGAGPTARIKESEPIAAPSYEACVKHQRSRQGPHTHFLI